MRSAKPSLVVITACCELCLIAATTQAQQGAAAKRHAAVVAKLSKQLRWNDEPSHQRYLAARNQATQQLLSEIDGFISDNFQPGTATADQVKAGLDILLGYNNKSGGNNFAFSVSLPSGKFLVAGVEIWRGGRAMAEDAVSIRAYKETGNKFVLAASTGDLHASDAEDPFQVLVSLCLRVLPNPPVPGELWLMASADVNVQAPPMVAMCLIAFDGEKFRTVWSPEAIVAEGSDSAVQFTPGGFTVNKLFDSSGEAALAPNLVIHDQYTLAADGPHMVGEWKTKRQ